MQGRAVLRVNQRQVNLVRTDYFEADSVLGRH